MKQLILAFFLLAQPLLSGAQELKIIKDNLNCSYGIKDGSGNWVLDPIYTLIQEYNSGYFLVNDPLGDGLLSPDGRWILACKYDRIDIVDRNWRIMIGYNSDQTKLATSKSFFMYASNGDKKSIFNSRGKSIVTINLNDDCKFDGNAHIRISHYSPFRTSFIDTSGNLLIDQKPGAILLFGERDYSLSGEGAELGYSIITGNVELVNREGERLLDEQFDRAMLTLDDRICFERDSCYGVMTINGEMIIPPLYRRLIEINSPDLVPRGWTITDKSGKFGIMNKDGTVLQEPKYDEVYPIYGNHRAQLAWMLKLDNKYGVLDFNGQWMVPMIYEQINPVYLGDRSKFPETVNFGVHLNGKWAYFIPKSGIEPDKFYDSLLPVSSYRYSYGQAIGIGLITKKNGKYGILNPDGSVLEECIFDNHTPYRSLIDHQLFWKGLELKEFYFQNDSIEKRQWTSFLVTENSTIYANNSNNYISVETYNSRILSVQKKDLSNEFFGNMLVLERHYSTSWEIYNYKTAQKVKLKNVVNITQSEGNRFPIHTRSNHHGVVDENGKIIVDTNYLSIQINYNSKDHIWALKEISGKPAKWILLDSNGRQVLQNLFDAPFGVGAGDQLVTQENQIGLLDSKTFKWKIRPEHPCLFRMAGEFYYVGTDENKKGIIRTDGTYLIEPMYDSILLLSSNCYSNGKCGEGILPEIRWLVRKGNVEILVDQDGKMITDVAWIDAFKESLLYDDTTFLIQKIQLKNFPVIDYTPSLHFLKDLTEKEIRRKRNEMWTNPTLKSQVYDSVIARWKVEKPIDRFGLGVYVIGSWGESTEDQKMRRDCECARRRLHQETSTSYQLDAIGANFVSIHKSYYYLDPMSIEWNTRSQSPPALPSDERWNFVYRNGKAEAIDLMDIFKTDSLLMQEFILSLQKREDLKLECSSLEMMIEMIEGKFSLDQDGVHLKLSQYSVNEWGAYVPVELIIPIENLNNHTETKWIVSILKEN